MFRFSGSCCVNFMNLSISNVRILIQAAFPLISSMLLVFLCPSSISFIFSNNCFRFVSQTFFFLSVFNSRVQGWLRVS